MAHRVLVSLSWLFTCVCVAFVSRIAIAEIALGLALLIGLADLFLLRAWPGHLAVDALYPIGAYWLLSLVSSIFSFSPGMSLFQMRELFLFGLFLLLLHHLRSPEQTAFLMRIVVASGFVLAVWGIVQYLGYPTDIRYRISGPISHYMTYSGLLLLTTLASLAHVLHATGIAARLVFAVAAATQVVALLLTLTRSAYLGFAAAVGLLVAVRVPRLLLLAPVVLVAVLALAPPAVFVRMGTIGSMKDETTLSRYYLWRGGLQMIGDYPYLGVGPRLVKHAYMLVYRDPRTPTRSDAHLHNNLLQVAAERGLPAAAAWIAIFVTLTVKALRQWRATPRHPAVTSAVLGLVAFQVAGLFEYNSGDSEVLLLLLTFAALPYAVGSSQGTCHAPS